MRIEQRLLERSKCKLKKRNGVYNTRNNLLRKKSLALMLRLRRERCAIQSQRRITRLISWNKLMSVIVSNAVSSRRKCLRREQLSLPSSNTLAASRIKRIQMHPSFNNGKPRAALSIELFSKA
jgi:hypothetical protein